MIILKCREIGNQQEVGGGKMDEGGQKAQTSNYKINKYEGCNVQHGKYN